MIFAMLIEKERKVVVTLYVNNDCDYKVSDNLSFTITDNTELLAIELKNKQN